MKPFLTAHWENILNLTYRIDPALLQDKLPHGLELDLFADMAHVSLVAFKFANTKVRGVKIPFHINFPEINLRYYVKARAHRGVIFLREFVPRYCVALIADKFYNEPYQAFPMTYHSSIQQDQLQIEHRLQKSGKWFSIQAQAKNKPFIPAETSPEHYFKEHGLGFGRDKRGNTLFYRVEHPVWEIYPVQNYELTVDFSQFYGPQWRFLNEQQPINALLAKGSAVKVFQPQPLEKLIE